MTQPSRRHSRQWALQILCQAETQVLQATQERSMEKPDNPCLGLPSSDKERLHQLAQLFFSRYCHQQHPDAYALHLVDGVAGFLFRIDDVLGRVSKGWKVSRMACIDRNVLRIAVYELLFGPKMPKRVVMNEAIEVARQFGTSGSAAFVNGVLDALAQHHLEAANKPK
ncbi:MAG: transcription antitermination factor NusB [Myxococcota bacterium]